jgi:hypothetical protein
MAWAPANESSKAKASLAATALIPEVMVVSCQKYFEHKAQTNRRARQAWHAAIPSRMTGQIMDARSSQKPEADDNSAPMNMGFTQRAGRLVDNHGLTPR